MPLERHSIVVPKQGWCRNPVFTAPSSGCVFVRTRSCQENIPRAELGRPAWGKPGQYSAVVSRYQEPCQSPVFSEERVTSRQSPLRSDAQSGKTSYARTIGRPITRCTFQYTPPLLDNTGKNSGGPYSLQNGAGVGRASGGQRHRDLLPTLARGARFG